MKARVLASVLSMCLLPAVADAQSFLDRLTIRQNNDTKQSVPKPGFFQVTFPEDGDATYEIGVGVTFAAVSRPLMTLGPSLEYLRNTATDKPIDSLKLGVESEWQLREVDGTPGARHSGVVLWRAKYSRDGIKDTKGLEASIAYTHFFAGPGRPLRPNTAFGPTWLTLIYAPVVGLELTNVVRAADASVEGTTVRLLAQLDVALYPFGDCLDNRLEATLAGAFRREVHRPAADTDSTHPFGTIGVTYYFVREDRRSMGVGATYVNGDDPTKGLASQRFFQVGLRIQFKE